MKMQRVWRQMIALLVVVSFIGTAILLFGSQSAKAQDDYTFGTESATKGTSASPTERNTENTVYNTLTEGDQYTNTNFSGSSENIVTGTGGGAAFPGALDTDDASRRTYTEANSGGGSPTYQILRPSGDGSPLTFTPTPTGTHYTTVDETTAGGNADTDYVTGTTNANEDTYAMSDASGSGNFDVAMWHWSRGITTSSCAIQYGLDIGGANYLGGTSTMTSTTYANFSYTWTLNPATSAEWTLAEVNALGAYLYMTDANPDARTTQVGILITLTPAASYTLDAQITYNSVASTSQTTGFQVLCQGYRNGDTENVNVQAWNYTSSAWVTKVTISAGSDTDYNFNLLGWAGNCERSSGNVVLLRLVDVTGADATQTVAYLDMLKVNRIEKGYALDVDMSATAVAQYGNITLRIKGYTSAEQFNVNVWNYTSSAYDMGKLAITSLSNTWQTTIDLYDNHHRSGTTVKIQFVDTTTAASDLVQDTLYLDVVWVTRYHTNPALSQNGCDPAIANLGTTVHFWAIYTDYDNEAPSSGYPKAHIDSTDYTMVENGTDTAYWDGKTYHYDKSDLASGSHNYYFIADDANSAEVTSGTKQVSIHVSPTLTQNGVTPSTGNNGESFTFFVTYSDADSDPASYVKAHIDSTDYDMTYNGTGGGYHYDKAMSGGAHTYYFKTQDTYSGEITTTPTQNLDVNNPPILSSPQRTPGDPVYVTTELTFRITYTDADGDSPTAIKWREGTGTIQNLTMTEVDPGDTDVTDGKVYEEVLYLSHGNHDYDFYATDGKIGSHVMGQGSSITVQNNAPTIDNKFADDHEWRNTYWEYDYAYTDLDGDTVAFQLSTNASFLNINSASGLVYGTTSDSVGWYDATVWCNDSYSGTDSDTFILYVDDREPAITNSPGVHVDQWRNQAWFYGFDFSDADGDSIAWERCGASWLTIASDGNLSGTTPETPGLYSFTVYANDSYGGSDDYSFDLDIINRLPMIGSSGNTTQTNTTYLAYHILANDDDSDVLSYALSTNASWASISGGWVNGTADGVGWYEFSVWANDSYDSDTEHWHLTVEPLVSNLAPYFTSDPIINWPNNTGYLYNVNAIDPEGQPLYYDLFGDIVALGFCTIDHETGQVTGLPHIIGDFTANVSVTEGANVAWQNWSLHVYTNTPVIDSTEVTEWQNGMGYIYRVHAHDPENEILTWTLDGNCTAFLSMDTFSGNVTNITGILPSMGWWFVSISVNDGFTWRYQNFTLTALNTAPYFSTDPILTKVFNTSYYYNANANDINSDNLTYSLVDSPEWLFVDALTGEVEGTGILVGDYPVNLRVWDGLNETWQNWTLSITDVPVPSVPTTPTDNSGIMLLITLGVIGLGAFVVLGKLTSKGKSVKKPEPTHREKSETKVKKNVR